MGDNTLKDYGIVFKSIMFNSKLSYGARTLYGILCTYRDMSSNTCYPGTTVLQEALGTNNRTRINDWFQELEDANAIKRHTEYMPTSHKKRRMVEILDRK